ncbi:YfhD family protein [Jeotgalibacillus salarius]|uniref:YfhD family protein n=1 Tax=Jeotgalibacillus salarius TaxID=546023 RepID=A0A4Y8LAU4_9BACL|nr:YfhD family protein [Jeotgalibacillus salarius]TFD99497.1 YfhD family protein [Jeotgalibacillus salarius]
MSKSNYQTSSKNKNSLPQTPKELKVDAKRNRTEEFAQELGLHADTNSSCAVNKDKKNRNK